MLQALYYLFFETVQAIPLKFLTLKALYLVFIVSSPQASEMAALVYRPHLSLFSIKAPSLLPHLLLYTRGPLSHQHQALCFLILFISKKCAPFLLDSGGLQSSCQMQTYSSCWDFDAFILRDIRKAISGSGAEKVRTDCLRKGEIRGTWGRGLQSSEWLKEDSCSNAVSVEHNRVFEKKGWRFLGVILHFPLKSQVLEKGRVHMEPWV